MVHEKLQRRVAGYHDIRMDGMTDLVTRANGASVMDVGCNRGLVAFEFANNGARVVHGCDNYVEGITTARHLFVDLRNVASQFEVVDLAQGPVSLAPFHGQSYDITVCLATLHKLRRVMPAATFGDLVVRLGALTNKYFGWRATSEKFDENEHEMALLDKLLAKCEMRRVHTSYLSRDLGVAAIWAKGY